MHHLSTILVLLVALLHVWILILEMFLWTKPPASRPSAIRRKKPS